MLADQTEYYFNSVRSYLSYAIALLIALLSNIAHLMHADA